MNAKELAKLLDGGEYREEVTEEISAAAKEHGLVIVYGASDDLVEFEGAIRDELGAYNDAELICNNEYVWPLIDDIESFDNIEDARTYFEVERTGKAISVIWSEEREFTWTIETEIPHETFRIYDEGEPFCKGIVFRAEDARKD